MEQFLLQVLSPILRNEEVVRSSLIRLKAWTIQLGRRLVEMVVGWMDKPIAKTCRLI